MGGKGNGQKNVRAVLGTWRGPNRDEEGEPPALRLLPTLEIAGLQLTDGLNTSAVEGHTELG
jgi:hypothetical protein